MNNILGIEANPNDYKILDNRYHSHNSNKTEGQTSTNEEANSKAHNNS